MLSYYFQALFRFPLFERVGVSQNRQYMSRQVNTVIMVNADGLSNVLQNKAWTKLYPAGVLTVEHRIYQAIPSNVSLIMDDSDIVYMTQEGGEPSAVSIGGDQPCNDGLGWRINVNYYGEPKTQLVRHHVQHYYSHCLTSRSTRAEYYMVLSLPEVFLGHDLQKDMIDGLHSLFDTKLESIEVLTAYHFDYIKGRDYILPPKAQETPASKL